MLFNVLQAAGGDTATHLSAAPLFNKEVPQQPSCFITLPLFHSLAQGSSMVMSSGNQSEEII